MKLRTLCASLAACSVAACFYPADRGRQLEMRVDKLTDDEKKFSDDTSAHLQDLQQKSEAKISEMNKALESLDRAEHRSDADVGVQLQKVAEDVAGLRGQVESYLFKLNELEVALKKAQDDMDAKITALAGEEAIKKAKAKEEADKLKRPTDKKEFLAMADEKAKGGDYPLARQLYVEWLKKWPKDELVGDAHYSLGETYYAEDKCREALSEYGQVIQNYPKAKFAPEAYWRAADCFKKLGNAKASKEALDELIKTYPKSEAAKKAKAKPDEKADSGKKKGSK